MRMTGITAAHVWYVSQYHPELLPDDELQGLFDARVREDCDREYWEKAAVVLNGVVARHVARNKAQKGAQ
jgi:hypothetical protein